MLQFPPQNRGWLLLSSRCWCLCDDAEQCSACFNNPTMVLWHGATTAATQMRGHAGKLQSNPTIQPRAEQCLIVNASEKLLKKEKFVFIIQNSFHLRAEIVKFSINRISPASTSTSPASSDYILLNKRTKETETCDPEPRSSDRYKHTDYLHCYT